MKIKISVEIIEDDKSSIKFVQEIPKEAYEYINTTTQMHKLKIKDDYNINEPFNLIKENVINQLKGYGLFYDNYEYFKSYYK